ncbi:MAG: F0F1 ATP synthase subunit delta, partial [Candidatus Omnitrophica bacterium]|nr:F0F1 ATP synthase subunit delta [Candidatus Omnitrophota bacterium]
MKEKLLGERYGEAFLSYAKDTIGFEKAAEELRNLKLFLHQNVEFFDFLKEPQIMYEAKCDVIDKV